MIERQEAMLMIERLQGAIDKLCFRLPGSSTTMRVGISIGVSFFPDDGETLETLMIKADRLMYRNKAARGKKARAGGSKVVAFAGKSGR